MKYKIYLTVFSTLVASASLLSAVDATVDISGKWSDSTTWGGTATGASIDNLLFDTSGLTLTVDTNSTFKMLDLSSHAGSTTHNIIIDTGKTLTTTCNTASDSIKVAMQGNSKSGTIINYSGDGSLVFNLSTSSYVRNGTFTFDTAVTHTTGSSLFFKNANINVNKTWTGTRDIAVEQNTTLNVNADMSVARFNAWGNDSKSNIAESVTLKSGAGFAITSGAINGNVVNSGNTSENYTMSFGRRYDGSRAELIIDSNATISNTNTSATNYFQIRNVNLAVNSATGSIKSNTDMLWSGVNVAGKETVITLNSTNAFSIRGESQAKAVVSIGVWDPNDNKNKGSSLVNLVLNANNDFGEFKFFEASDAKNSLTTESILNVKTNGHMMTIGKISDMYDGTKVTDGHTYLKLEALTDWTVKINYIDNLICESVLEDADLMVFKTNNIQFSELGSDIYKDTYLVSLDGGQSFWINTSGAIPEPSTFALIIGALTLGVVAYRRKN